MTTPRALAVYPDVELVAFLSVFRAEMFSEHVDRMGSLAKTLVLFKLPRRPHLASQERSAISGSKQLAQY